MLIIFRGHLFVERFLNICPSVHYSIWLISIFRHLAREFLRKCPLLWKLHLGKKKYIMNFTKGKYRVSHLGLENPMPQYSLWADCLKKYERNSGVRNGGQVEQNSAIAPYRRGQLCSEQTQYTSFSEGVGLVNSRSAQIILLSLWF